MKLSIVLLSSLASMVMTQPIHDHHQHKRDAEPKVDIVTNFVTQVVTKGVDRAAVPGSSQYSYSLTGSSFAPVLQSSTSPTEPINSSKQTESASSPTTTSNSPSSPTTTGSTGSTDSTTTLQSSSSTPEESSNTASSTSSTSSSSESSGSGSGSGSGGGNSAAAKGAKGITYSPYSSSGSCKDSSTIKSDIKKLSEFDIIRLYDTDCSGVENVLNAKSSSQKLFAGIYHINKIQDSVDILSKAIKNIDNGWDNIDTVSIGNELVNSGQAKPSDIKTAIDTARSSLKSAGYSGKIVSVDTLVAVQNNDELCQYSDYIAVNSHPFWDGNTVASGSGDFLKTQIENIKKQCGGKKDVLITETGWPTKGDDYQKAIPSSENQKTALQSIVDKVGDQVILFTTYNDFWKQPGQYNVEQYWGIFD